MLRRYDPFREMSTLRGAIDRLFNDTFARVDLEPFGTMPLDIYEEGDKVVVKASVAGFKPEEIKVTVRDDILDITAESKQENEKKERNYHLREHRFGKLERSVVLPITVNQEKAEAVFANGILTLTLPKGKEAAVKRIPIKSLNS